VRPTVLLVLAAALAAPGAARATIVPQHGMRGGAIGMTRQQVEARIGTPRKVTHGTGPFGPWTSYAYSGLVVQFVGNRTATSFTTTARRERTPHGVGVGSTPAAVAAKVRGARCLTESSYRHCYVGRWSAGRVVTDFAVRRGRVWRVTVGVVID
jgi:hypothetical protein